MCFNYPRGMKAEEVNQREEFVQKGTSSVYL